MDGCDGAEQPRETLRVYWRAVGGIGEYTRRGRITAAEGTMGHHPLYDVGNNAVRIIVRVWQLGTDESIDNG